MTAMQCRCGQQVYFNNDSCVHCGRLLAFDPHELAMQSEEAPGSGLPTCANRRTAVRCNWTPVPANEHGYCLSCAMSKTIPTLSKPKNHDRWRKLEAAKRRLILDLLLLGLPVDESRLQFHFKEDRRTNPDVSDYHVTTGHSSGAITINAAEADEVFREEMRQAMNEPWRTLLGHMRHESGHYYFTVLVTDENLAEVRGLFGDESQDYDAALRRHYENGPRADWSSTYISAYASSHPAEDWAECWAHYLHIRAVLQVAVDAGLLPDGNNWYERFIELVLSLNEIMRSLGLPDAYPFVLTEPVVRKIEMVHRVIAERAV
ncbi:MAG: putative zinc-binding peptidase [Gammaproteobacteria bacterium]|nr:putative zinc-binding peptidase [Gammaproteobacteria bacterium]